MLSYLYSFFFHYNNIWNEKVQNTVFYEAFLPITGIKPRACVTKCSECMGSHVARDIAMPRTVRMVLLWVTKSFSKSNLEHFYFTLYRLKC